jgi:hypothetical protein
MALSASLVPATAIDRRIDAPVHTLVGESRAANLLSAQATAANSKSVKIAGFKPSLFIKHTATSFTLVVYTSPDGVSWFPIATITEATAVKHLGPDDLKAPVDSIVCDLTAVAGGHVTIDVYGERARG